MAQETEQDESDPVVAAIERVLSVESNGVRQLRESQEQGNRLIGQARAEADAIGKRADACISRLQRNYLQKVQRDIESLAQANAPSASHADDTYSQAMLMQAVRRVAAQMTGGA